MARYAREKCGANSVFWLATSAGRDNPSCRLFERRLCLGHIGQYNKLFIEQACLRTMPKYQPRSWRRALLSPYFGHPREPRGSQTAVRRLGTIIRSIFLCPIRSQHSLDRLERSGESRYPGLFRPSLKTFVAPFLPTRLTAPGPPRMYFGKYKIIFITHIVTP